MNHNGAALCLQAQPFLDTRMHVFGCNTRVAPVTQSATWVRSSLNAFTFPSTNNVSNNCIYFQSHLLTGTYSIATDLMTTKLILFLSIGHKQSCHFFLLAGVIADDCAMTLAFQVLQKIRRIKYHYNAFPRLDVI